MLLSGRGSRDSTCGGGSRGEGLGWSEGAGERGKVVQCLAGDT